MKEKPSFIKTSEVLITDYFYQLTPKEKQELETFIIKLKLQEAESKSPQHC